jgi:hypothetical protein
MTAPFPDWYGDDHIIVSYKSLKGKIKFKEFKIKSWQKVNAMIDIKTVNSDIVVEWQLRTLWTEESGKSIMTRN